MCLPIMSKSFVTETISEELQVLCFSQTPVLFEAIEKTLEQKNIHTQVVSSLPSAVEKFFAQLSPTTEYYRIIWIDDLTNIHEESSRLLLPFFHTRNERTALVTHQPYQLTGSSDLPDPVLERIKKSEEILHQLERKSPYTSFFSYDALLDAQLTSLLFLLIKNGVVFGEKRSIYPDNVEGFIEKMIEQLSMPRGGQRKNIGSSLKINKKSLSLYGYPESDELQPVDIQKVGEWKQVESDTLVNADFTKQVLIALQSLKKSRPTLPKPAQPVVEKKKTVQQSELPRPVEKKIEKKEQKKQQVLIKEQPLKAVSSPGIREQASIKVRFIESTQTVGTKVVQIPVNTPPQITRSKIVLKQFEKRFHSSLNVGVALPMIEKTITMRNVSVVNPRENVIKQSRVESTRALPPTEKSTDLDSKIQNLFQEVLPQQPVEKKVTARKEDRQALRKVRAKLTAYKKLVFGVGSVCVVVLVMLVMFYGSRWVLIQQFTVLAADQPSESFSHRKVQIVKQIARGLSLQTKVYSVILNEQLVTENYSLSQVFTDLAELYEKSNQISTQQTALMASFIKSSSVEYSRVDSVSLASQVEELYKEISRVESRLKELQQQPSFKNPQRSSSIEKTLETLSERRNSLLVSRQVLLLFPELFPEQSPRTIAVVLQDENELRPSGGFIHAVALLSVDRQQVNDIRVKTAAEIDQNLAGMVVAPPEVKEYLGEDFWYFRDANWNPDFAESGKQIQWFLQKSLNEQIDGVVVMNSGTLSALNQIFEASVVQNEEIGEERSLLSEQLIQRAREIEQAQRDVQKDYYTQQFENIFAQFGSASENQLNQASQVLGEDLQRAEILVYSPSIKVDTALASLGWNGQIMLPSCPSVFAQNGCGVSRIYQLDSNVGINKVNHYIEKNAKLTTKLQHGQSIYNYILSYENRSNSISWPGGVYKNFASIYLDADVEVESLLLNGEAVTEKYSIQKLADYQRLTVYFEVPVESTTLLEVNYRKTTQSPPFAQTFFYQKQPGISAHPLTILIQYDPEFIPTVIAPDAEVSNTSIEFTTKLNQHFFGGALFK